MVFNKIGDAIKKAAEEREKKDIEEEKAAKVEVSPQIVAYHNSGAKIADQYHTLWAHILFLNTNNTTNLNTIAITSSHHQEGTTVTAVNLAVVMAQDSEKKILLMDCDLRKPTIHKLLGLTSPKGLSDILKGDSPLESVLLNTDIKNLTVLPAGKSSSNPTGLLTSQKMKHLLTELKKQFGYIILDTPPVIPYADPRILGPLVNGVILTIQANKTRRQVIWQTESILTGIGIKIFGYVLTKVEYPIPEYIHRHL